MLVCASMDHTFLYDVHTGSLVQTINICLQSIGSVDVNVADDYRLRQAS
jgi:hypothetical protein